MLFKFKARNCLMINSILLALALVHQLGCFYDKKETFELNERFEIGTSTEYSQLTWFSSCNALLSGILQH